MRARFVLLTSAIWVSSLVGQTPGSSPNPTLASRLAAIRYELSVEDGKLKGTGAAVLQTAIAQANYVLLGEDHLTREIPRFTAAVCNAMGSTGGLSALAFEASPAVAAFWGFDQEFLGSAGWISERMLATHPGPIARNAILRLQTLEHSDVDEARKTGDYSRLFMMSVPETELANATAAIEKDGTPATLSAFRELTESRAIYLEQGTNASESNARRARLMKRNLVTYFKAAGDDPPQRILFKFGDWHLYKGINPLQQRDLGNFVAELADGQGRTSLHILVLGAKGTHAVYSGYDRPLKLEPFVMQDDPDYHWLKPAINLQEPNSWTLFDLRELRFQALDLDVDWQRVVYGYDLLILIPKLTPGAFIQ